MTQIHAILIGQPQVLTDEKGAWRSSIFRSPVNGPIWLGRRGLAGDQVTDAKNHGSADQAVCCHDLGHYAHWNRVYGLDSNAQLAPGSVGENWTLVDGSELQLCVGDIYTVGEAQIQISAPRYPCQAQQRKVSLPDFVRNTKQTMRTGFYLRVLREGMVQAGDVWQLVERPQAELTLEVVNRSIHYDDPELAQQLLSIPELAEGWKTMLIDKYRME